MRKKTKLTLNVRKKKHYYPKRDFMGSSTACVAQKRLSARKLKNTPKISAKPLNITSPILSSQKKKTLKRSQTKGSPRKIHYTPTKSPHHKRFKPSKLPFTCLKPETNQPESSSFSCFKPIDSDSDDEIHIKVNNSSVEDEVKHSDQSSETQDEMNEMIRLIPIVLDKITSEGLERNLFVDFFRQISSNTYPIKNIAFLLWTEVVSWYNQDTSSTMRYSEETKKFWKLGYQIFGGKFIRFMSGFKNESQIVFGEASKGKCAPDKSDINFVVPTLRLLREFKPYGSGNEGMQEPGIFYDYIQEISPSLESKSACLTFDGKKLKQGLTSTSGDVNILGFEDGPSLDERLSALKVELDKETAIISNLVDCVDDTKQLPEASKSQLKQDFDRICIKLSKNVQEIREVKRKKEYAKEKFIERGGSDWRHGTFVYVISAIHAYLFDINCYLTRAGEVMETINRWNAYLQNSERMYAQDNVVKLQIQSNYIPLPDVTTETENTRYIKQRTEQWLNIRKEAKVSGSTIYGALGLDGLKAQKQHFDKVICGFADPSPTQEAMKAMQYGTDNEINAVSTLVGRIMPVVAPDLCYHEEGCYRLDDNSFMIVSPDGSLRKDDDSCVMGVEFKCPTIKVHTEVPVRYYLQCLAEMEVLDCDQLLFVSWRPDITTVFLILRNSTLFRDAYEVAKLIYGDTNPKRPTKLLESSKRLKEEIKICCNRSRFLGEFQLVTLATTEITAPTSELLGGQHKVSDLKQLYNDIGQLTRDGYELLRQKASEALVFLCCDLDRTWNKDELRWSPVCWCPKGYSLSTETLRKLLEKVHDECFAAGIHVPAVSFDGQWHNVVVRSVKWKPLTILQLQKDTWKEVLNMTKTAILKEVMKVENKPNWYWIDLSSAEQINGDTPSGRMLICTNNGLAVPKTTSKGWVT